MADIDLIQNPSGCYVYEIIVDGVIRYVGKGKGGRAHRHLQIAKRMSDPTFRPERLKIQPVHVKLAEALRAGAVIEHRIVVEGLTDLDAFVRESDHMALVGEQLWNELPGGSGFPDPAKYRARLMAGVNARWKDPKEREKAKAAAKKRWENVASRITQSHTIRRIWTSEERRKKHGEKLLARFATADDFSKWQSAMAKSRWQTRRMRKSTNLFCSVLSFGT